MPRPLQTVDDLHQYLSAVMAGASHHGENVTSVILALAGAVVLFKDAGSGIVARTYSNTRVLEAFRNL